MVILPITMLYLLSSCNLFECENDVPGLHDFVLPATLSPALDTFRIGDTIRISSIFDKQVYEKKLQKTFTLDNWQFFPGTVIFNLDTFFVQDNALENFEVIIDPKYNYDLFYFSTGRIDLIGEYTYENDTYSLEFILIPIKKGDYMLLHGSSLEISGSEQDFPGKCQGQRSGASVAMNGGGDNNIELLANTSDTVFYEWVMRDPQFRYYDSGGYCFYVVE
jgi:hypothetical protein